MNVKEALLKRFDEGTLYGIDRKTIENGHEFYFNPSTPLTFKDNDEYHYSNDIGTKSKYDGILFYVKFHPKLNFIPDYFHHKSLLTDGTLFAENVLIKENLTSMIGSHPAQLEFPPIDKIKSITYIYSNSFITIEHGNFGTKEKPWLQERISCWTPVKFEYELKEDNQNDQT